MLHRLLRWSPAPAQLTSDPATSALTSSASDAQEIADHVKSLRAIPEHELPDAEARAALVALAQSGAEVYAYTPVASTTHTIWIRPEHPWQDGRMTPAEWVSRYRARLADDALDVLAAQGGEV